MEFTGERFLPNLNWPELSYEHWHRYLWVSQRIADKRVLDIACGEGYGSALLAEVAEYVLGVDISPLSVDHASATYIRSNIEFRVGTTSNIPCENASFDNVVSFETIEHLCVEDQILFLEETKRVLGENGSFIVSTPNKLLYSDRNAYKNEYHLREFYQDEFIVFLQQYFKHVILLGQRVYPTSYIWPTNYQSTEINEFQIDYINGQFFPITKDKKENVYIIAVCSDKPMVDFKNSILIDVAERALREKVERSVEQNVFINGLKQQILNYDKNFYQMNSLIDRRNAVIQQLHADFIHTVDENAIAQQKIDELQNQLEHYRRDVEYQISLLVEKSLFIDALKKMIVKQKSMEGAFNAELTLLRRTLQEIHQSRFWKLSEVTWPLRYRLKRLYQKIKQMFTGRVKSPAELPFVQPKSIQTLVFSSRQLNAFRQLLEKLQVEAPIDHLLSALVELMTFDQRLKFIELLNYGIQQWREGDTPARIVQGRDIPINTMPEYKLNILFICGEFPNPIHGGGGRVADFIRVLGQNHNIYLFAWYIDDRDKDALQTLRRFLCKFECLSLEEFEHGSVDRLNAFINGHTMDVIHYEWPRSLRYYSPQLSERHIFTYMEAISLSHYMRLQNQVLMTEDWLEELHATIQALAIEVATAHGLDAYIVLTKRDGDFLSQFTPDRTYTIIDAYLNISDFVLPDYPPNPRTITFVGNFRHPPNEEAVIFFFSQIFWRVQEQIPDLKVYIVGAYPSERILQYHDNYQIIVTGTVKDIRPYIQQSSICIAPLISGAGMRGKVNQYAALRRVCVASTVAVSGLAYTNGKDIIIANDPIDFAEEVVNLLQNPELAADMGEAAYATVIENASINISIQQLLNLYSIIKFKPFTI